VKAKVVKNKVAPPFRQAEFDLMHSGGISREGDLLDLGIEDKIIEKSGGWHNYGEVRLGNGRENAKQFLRDNAALVDEISRKILEKRGLATPAAPAESNGAAAEPAAKPEQPTTSRRRQAAAAPSES
jgi:recombination protein RecA